MAPEPSDVAVSVVVNFVGGTVLAYLLARIFSGRRWWRAVAIIPGLVAGGVFVAFTLLSVFNGPAGPGRVLLAILLIVIAAIYVGFALVDARPSRIGIELGWAVATAGTAYLGLVTSPVFLTVGYVTHAGWDLAHHVPIQRIDTRAVPGWYPWACLIYDVPLGVAALLLR